jgi:pimeloyl-ACP methyl ester carboxylesterase
VVPVDLRSGGRTLAARLFRPSRPAGPGVLFVHGLYSSQAGYEERAEALVRRIGAVCLTFDLGGHDESEGLVDALSISDHLEDVFAAYDRLAAESDVDPSRIGVAAASYGAFLAALLVARRPVARLAIRAPALYADSELDVPLGARVETADIPETSAALEALERFPGPVLIVESEKDEVVPADMTAAYRRARPDAEHVTIAGARHHLSRHEWRAAFLTVLLEFFQDL